MDDLRAAAAEVARRARFVHIDEDRIREYAVELAAQLTRGAPAPPPPPGAGEREAVAARWLILDAINFGSGWFPELRKRLGMSGSRTIAAALTEHLDRAGRPWTAAELVELRRADVAAVLEQDAAHELMGLYAASLNDLGRHIATEYGGSFAGLVDTADGSAVTLARTLGGWASFADTSAYGELTLPFLKRAQIAAADLHRAGAAHFTDLGELTMFADNLVPHVLRLDGVLRFDADLVARIERGELLIHGSAEEVEMRAAAVDAVERLVATLGSIIGTGAVAAGRAGPPVTAAAVDEWLWHRGQAPAYKAVPRPRCRTTAY